MIGLGTLINVGAIIIGGLLGLFLGRNVKVRYQDILMIAVGICVLMLGIGGTMEQMLSITDGGLAQRRLYDADYYHGGWRFGRRMDEY